MSAYAGTAYREHYRSMFECVDKNPDSLPGSAANTDGAQFWHTEASCNGLPCPPLRPPEGTHMRSVHQMNTRSSTHHITHWTPFYKPSLMSHCLVYLLKSDCISLAIAFTSLLLLYMHTYIYIYQTSFVVKI